ncbi:MAG: methyltransferase domain-containing protein [Lentisphaeria bacterium]|nr:methyltransferase domain-containing protein [Lentisphaeria bacterium]
MNSRDTHDEVKDYYGKTLQSSNDLQSSCCTAGELPMRYRKILAMLDDEIEGLSVLDLGCGTGRDCYLMSNLVGEDGHVIGLDMTDEQLDVANKYIASMTEKFGYAKANIEFRKGIIEDLSSAGIEDNSIDLIVSNCVINLATDKEAVLSEALRVLKPGGEIFFSDVYSDRRIPQELRDDEVFYGECLGGALYYEDFRRIMQTLGCHDHRIVTKTKIDLNNAEIEAKAGNINFYSITVRAFKLDLEDLCEDYGQTVTYKGSDEFPHAFVLDDHHTFETGRPMLVCGNTFDMLNKTRFSELFDFSGDKSVHYGLFDCSDDLSTNTDDSGACC